MSLPIDYRGYVIAPGPAPLAEYSITIDANQDMMTYDVTIEFSQEDLRYSTDTIIEFFKEKSQQYLNIVSQKIGASGRVGLTNMSVDKMPDGRWIVRARGLSTYARGLSNSSALARYQGIWDKDKEEEEKITKMMAMPKSPDDMDEEMKAWENEMKLESKNLRVPLAQAELSGGLNIRRNISMGFKQ